MYNGIKMKKMSPFEKLGKTIFETYSLSTDSDNMHRLVGY